MAKEEPEVNITDDGIRDVLLGALSQQPPDNGFLVQNPRSRVFQTVNYNLTNIMAAVVKKETFPSSDLSLDDFPGNMIQKRLRLAQHRRYEKYIVNTVKRWMKYREKHDLMSDKDHPIDPDKLGGDAKKLFDHVSGLLKTYQGYLASANEMKNAKDIKPSTENKKQKFYISEKHIITKQGEWNSMNMLNKSSRGLVYERIRQFFIRIKPRMLGNMSSVYDESKGAEKEVEKSSDQNILTELKKGEKELVFESDEKFLSEGIKNIEFSVGYKVDDIVQVQKALGMPVDDHHLSLQDMFPNRMSKEEVNLKETAIYKEKIIFKDLLDDLKDFQRGGNLAPTKENLLKKLKDLKSYLVYRESYNAKPKDVRGKKNRVIALRNLVNFQKDLVKGIAPQLLKTFKSISEKDVKAIHDDILLERVVTIGDPVKELNEKYADKLQYIPLPIGQCEENVRAAYDEVVGQKMTNSEIKDIIKLYTKVRKSKVDRLFGREKLIYEAVNKEINNWIQEGLKINSDEGVKVKDLSGEILEKYNRLTKILGLLEKYEESKYHMLNPTQFELSKTSALVELRDAQKKLGRDLGVSVTKRKLPERGVRKLRGVGKKVFRGAKAATKAVQEKIAKSPDFRELLQEESPYDYGEKGLKASLGQEIIEEYEEGGYDILAESIRPALGDIIGKVREVEKEGEINKENTEINVKVPAKQGEAFLKTLVKHGEKFDFFSHAYYLPETDDQAALCSLSSKYGSALVTTTDEGDLHFEVAADDDNFYVDIPLFIAYLCDKEGWNMADVNVSIPLEGVSDNSAQLDQAWKAMEGFAKKRVYVSDFDFSRFEDKATQQDLVKVKVVNEKNKTSPERPVEYSKK